MQLRIRTALENQLVVRAALGNATSSEHEDLIRVADSRHTVRDDDRRPRAHDRAKPEQNLLLGVGVNRRQRVIQNQDAGIDGNGARERRALFLTT